MTVETAPGLPQWAPEDLARIDALIRSTFNTDVALIAHVIDYILHASQRARPLLVLAVGRSLGLRGERLCELAAAIELIHDSLALHSEVQEEPAAGAVASSTETLFGNAGGILLGDLLYTGSFKMIVGLGDMALMRVVADATNRIAEGEVLQFEAEREGEQDFFRHVDIVRQRSAPLFAAGSECVGLLAGVGAQACAALAAFGRHYGTAHTLSVEPGAHPQAALARAVADELAMARAQLDYLATLSWGGGGFSAQPLLELLDGMA